MLKFKPITLAATFLFAVIPLVCSAQEFSADVVYLPENANAPSSDAHPSAHQNSKLFVSKDKMRLETRGLTGTILLVNGAEQATVALFPAEMKYQPLANPPGEYFRVTDPENACSDWQHATTQKIVCEKVGHETVNGRDAVKYENKSGLAEASPTAVWVDKDLHFVIKWTSANAGAELHNIILSAQPAALFVVPSSYELLTPKKKPPKRPK